MASGFTYPSVAELVARITADFNGRLSAIGINVDSGVPNTLLYVLARVFAGSIWLVHRHAEFVSNQIIPTLATKAYLDLWASLFGVTRSPGVKATGAITITGTPLTVVPAGTIWERADGAQYQTLADVTLSDPAGTAAANIEALEYGEASNQIGNVTLELLNAQAGVNSEANSLTAFTGGLNEETDPQLRVRLQERIANTPQAGAGIDYIRWTKEAITNVQNVWVTQGELGPGTVTVRFSMVGTGTDVIPSAQNVADVQDYIDETDAAGNTIRRPITADVTVTQPVGQAIDIELTVNGGGAPSLAIQAAIEAELESLFTEGAPGGTIQNSRIRAAISRAEGEVFHTLDDVDGLGGAADITIGANSLIYLQNVVYN